MTEAKQDDVPPLKIDMVEQHVYHVVITPFPERGTVREMPAPPGFRLHSFEIVKSNLSRNGQTNDLLLIFEAIRQTPLGTQAMVPQGDVTTIPLEDGGPRPSKARH